MHSSAWSKSDASLLSLRLSVQRELAHVGSQLFLLSQTVSKGLSPLLLHLCDREGVVVVYHLGMGNESNKTKA
jgi:hypothetical protein